MIDLPFLAADEFPPSCTGLYYQDSVPTFSRIPPPSSALKCRSPCAAPFGTTTGRGLSPPFSPLGDDLSFFASCARVSPGPITLGFPFEMVFFSLFRRSPPRPIFLLLSADQSALPRGRFPSGGFEPNFRLSQRRAPGFGRTVSLINKPAHLFFFSPPLSRLVVGSPPFLRLQADNRVSSSPSRRRQRPAIDTF